MRLSKARREFVTAMMKDTIIEAAGSVLEEHGVSGITMNRVATTAGLAKASLYNYFQDKDDLLRFVYTRLVEPYFQAIEEIAGGDLPASQKLQAILRIALERSDKDRGIIQLLRETPQERHEIKNGTRPRYLRTLASIFEQGILEGAFRPHEPTHAAHMFYGSLSELFEMRASDTPNDEVNEYAGALIGALLNGFSIHPEKSPGSGEASPSV